MEKIRTVLKIPSAYRVKQIACVLTAGIALLGSSPVWAKGYTDVEPDKLTPAQAWTNTFYIDANAATNGTGTSESPFKSIKEGRYVIQAARDRGENTRVILREGTYREDLNLEFNWTDKKDILERRRNAVFTVEGDTTRPGKVIISANDDWSQGQKTWTQVDAARNIWVTDWPYAFGLYAGDRGGGANLRVPVAQRNEQVFVQPKAGGDKKRYTQRMVEKWDYYVHPDTGQGTESWTGKGLWFYKGYAGPSALDQAETFGVAELSDSEAATKQTIEVGKPNPDHNPRETETPKNARFILDKTATLKDVFAENPHPNPAKLYVRLPEGAKISDYNIEVSTRGRVLWADDDKNLILRNLAFEGGNNRHGSAAAYIGKNYFDYKVNMQNVLIENCTFNASSQTGLLISGTRFLTARNCKFSNNGASAMNPNYLMDIEFIDCEFNRNLWRQRQAAPWGYGFGNHSVIKSWRSKNITYRNIKVQDNGGGALYQDDNHVGILIENSTFQRNTGGGINWEISSGPSTIRNNVITDNGGYGIDLGSSDNITVENNDIRNNEVAQINMEHKTRTNDGTFSADPQFGEEIKVDAKEHFVSGANQIVRNNKIATNRGPQSRLIKITRYSTGGELDANLYNPMVNADPAKKRWYDNKYYHTDSKALPFVLKGMKKDIYAEWLKATGETGSSWDPTLTGNSVWPVVEGYAPGFIWKRSTDVSRHGTQNPLITLDWLPSIANDSNGQPAWYNFVMLKNRDPEHDSGVGTGKEWYKGLQDMAQDYGKTSAGVHEVRYTPIETVPGFAADYMSAQGWASTANAGYPIVKWQNPTGQNATVRLTGTIKLEWASTWDSPIDLAIYHERADGSIVEKFSRSFPRPAGAAPASTAVDLTKLPGVDKALADIVTAPGEKIGITIYHPKSGSYPDEVKAYDDVTFTLQALSPAANGK